MRLRKSALLLFAKNPGKWHPRSRVRILKVNGLEEKPAPEYNVTEISDISGNIFELAVKSWEALRPALSETRYSEDGLFKTQVIYPETACREALINAITHRDYNLEGRGIEIRIFTDRLQILSPGELLSKLTIDDLKELEGVHESRNVYIARVLREYGYVRELGEGMRRMFKEMSNNEMAEPRISSPNKSFIVELFYKSIILRRGEAEEGLVRKLSQSGVVVVVEDTVTPRWIVMVFRDGRVEFPSGRQEELHIIGQPLTSILLRRTNISPHAPCPWFPGAASPLCSARRPWGTGLRMGIRWVRSGGWVSRRSVRCVFGAFEDRPC